MGNCCFSGSKRKRRSKIVLLLLGLDNAGKTVAARNLVGESRDAVVPTVGFSVVELRHGGYDVKVYDLGGRPDFRDIWHRYYVDAHGIIFVIDSSDHGRFAEAQEVLGSIISHEKVRGKPLLLLGNKQDNDEALDDIDLIERLQLERLINKYECPTLVESCSATDRDRLDPGIKKGYDWMISYVIREYAALNRRVQTDVMEQELVELRERQEKMERLRQLSELEARRVEVQPAADKQPNGLPLSDVYIIRNNKYKHSDSDSSQSTDSLPRVYYGTIQQEVVPSERPKSATSAVRRQLESAASATPPRSKSALFRSNKTAPANVYGPQSAGRIRAPRSAGDSIFVVSSAPKLSLPPCLSNDGSGDPPSVTKSGLANGHTSDSVLPCDSLRV